MTSVYVVTWIEDDILTCRVFSLSNRDMAEKCVNRCANNEFPYLFAEETIDREVIKEEEMLKQLQYQITLHDNMHNSMCGTIMSDKKCEERE